MSIYEHRPLHLLRLNTSEMEVSVQYKNQKGIEDVIHLPLNYLRQSGKMINNGKRSFVSLMAEQILLMQGTITFRFALN